MFNKTLIETSDYKTFISNKVDPGSVDLILTDPPYAISKKTGFKSVVKGEKRFSVDMDFGEWDHSYIDVYEMSKLFFNALRIGGTCIVWYDIWKIGKLGEAMCSAGFNSILHIIWQKTNPVPLNSKSTYLSNSREMAVVGIKGVNHIHPSVTFNLDVISDHLSIYDGYHNGVFRYAIPRFKGGRVHPTQKSLDLFTDLVKLHSNQDDLVCDPFLGSGTTAVVAVQNFRNFCGCDIDDKYVNISKDRLGMI